ncbi:MAG: hypothetical protein IPK53_08105 [bacterium]|nr:hypothetical protein [bacterium]
MCVFLILLVFLLYIPVTLTVADDQTNPLKALAQGMLLPTTTATTDTRVADLQEEDSFVKLSISLEGIQEVSGYVAFASSRSGTFDIYGQTVGASRRRWCRPQARK